MGKGGGGTTQSTGTTYTTNLPEYAQPYVETMLGATQKQLFQTQETPGVYDPNTGQTSAGTTEITGFQPYTPYSTDPSKYVAGFSPLQQQAQQTVAGMQTPGEYGYAQGLAGLSGMGQMRAGTDYLQGIASPGVVQGFMSPYQQAVTDIAKSNAVREAQIAGQQANLGAARQGTYGGARQALMGAERERNLLSNLSNIQAQGSQAAYDKAMQNMQYGAGLNLQGLQGAAQTAGTIGSLAGQQFGTQKDIIGLQQQTGAQQQAQQQQIINQAIQDYANAQQYPMMQLGFMSNMLRGLPMQSTSSQQYVAAPNQLTQGLGAIGTGANIYSAFSGNATKVAQGGQIKSYAKGGITSYDVGGNVKSDLSRIRDPEELREIARNTTSDVIRDEALRFAKMREMGFAGGGIVAFADGKRVYGKTAEDYIIPDSPELKERREADIAAALALKAKQDAENPAPTDGKTVSSIMFDQMKNRPANNSGSLSSFMTDALYKPEESANKGITQVSATENKKDEAAPAVVTENKKNEAAPTAVTENKKNEAAPAAVTENKKDQGIKSVTPGTEGISRKRANIPGLSATAQAIYDRSLPEEQSLTDIFKEIRTARESAIGPNKALQEDRANVMAEKANAQEEARRQGKLRQAKFWADFGSTPGPVLVAAMTAFKKNADNIIEGEKEARKVQGDLDKIIRDLNKAERLEQEGDFDAAYKLKLDAKKEAKEINKVLLQYQMTKETAALKSDGGGGGNKLLGALKYEESVRKTIDKEKNDKNGTYYQARTFLSNLQDTEGKTYKDKELKERVDKARAVVRAKDLEYAKLTDKAKRTVDFYKGVADIDSGNMPSDTTAETAPSSPTKKGDLPPGVVPPNSKYIGTFKGNPVYQLEDGTKKVVKSVS